MARIMPYQMCRMKERGEFIPMVTAYDFLMAKLVDSAGIPVILVGDSIGMTVLGYETTQQVDISDIIRASRAVAHGAKRALIIADMPFMSYQPSITQAVKNAGRLVSEGYAQAVKVEGGAPIASTVKCIVEAGIPVMGHIGLTPQSIYSLGGYRVQGKNKDTIQKLLNDALDIQEAGAFAIVVELVSDEAAKVITNNLSIPTIGIGAGSHVNGQVQVITDMLGMDKEFIPKHAKPYTNLASIIEKALRDYATDVRNNTLLTK